MNINELRSFAYVSDESIDGEIKAVCLNFPGLGGMEMKSALDPADVKLAHRGMLFVYPFVNPWNWMNQPTVEFADEVMSAVKTKFSIADDCPLILRGGSMGGYSVLTYAMFSRYRVDGIFALCPVTDLYFHFSERPDLPRTIHSAMGDYGDISELLRQRSPNHHPEKLPAACRYLIIHGCQDDRVNKAAHSDTLVPLMRQRNLDVTYIEDPTMRHCGPMNYASVTAIERFLDSFLPTAQ